MRKSILIGLAFSALALGACAAPYDDGYYSSGVSTSVHVGISDYYYVPHGYYGQPAYYYGYRSRVYRPGFYYYQGFYYPDRHPYYRSYHRNFSRWHDWDRRHWAAKPRPGKSWRPADRDRRDHLRPNRNDRRDHLQPPRGDRRDHLRPDRNRDRKAVKPAPRPGDNRTIRPGNNRAAQPGLENRNRSHGGRLERNR